jgi:hypothetical protein
MKPLIQGFTSTTLVKAFILNGVSMALVTGLTVSLTMVIDDAWARHRAKQHPKKKTEDLRMPAGVKIGVAVAIALVSALVVYAFMWLLLGYGRGMLASPDPSDPRHNHGQRKES